MPDTRAVAKTKLRRTTAAGTPLFTGPNWDFGGLRKVHDAIERIAFDELGLDIYPLQIEVITSEQMLDSIVEITGVPEKFLAYYPGVRAVNLADGGVPSSFLDMYDRPKRDAAKCERNENISLRQAMNMMAGDTVNQKIRSDRGNLARMIAEGRTDDEIVEHFYLAALGRYPAAEEKDMCHTAVAQASTRRAGLENVVWALLDGNEFLYNH